MRYTHMGISKIWKDKRIEAEEMTHEEFVAFINQSDIMDGSKETLGYKMKTSDYKVEWFSKEEFEKHFYSINDWSCFIEGKKIADPSQYDKATICSAPKKKFKIEFDETPDLVFVSKNAREVELYKHGVLINGLIDINITANVDDIVRLSMTLFPHIK